MTDIERMLIEHQCAKLCVLFHTFNDASRYDDLLQLFAADAVWEHPSGATLASPEAMRAYVDGKSRLPVIRHVVSNIAITVQDKDNAEGECYATVFYGIPAPSGEAHMQAPKLVAHYHDRFVRMPAGWRFARRRARVVLKGDGYADMIRSREDEARLRGGDR